MATTTPQLHRSRLLRPDGDRATILRLGALVLGVLVAELGLALVIVEARLLPVLLAVAGGAILAVFFRFPLIGVVALLLTAASVFPSETVSFELGPLRTPLYEVVLAGLLVVAILKPRRATWGGRAGAALGLFFVVLAASEVAALLAGRAEAIDIFNWGRPFLMLALFFVVVRLFHTRRSARHLLVAAAVVAAVTGVVSLLVAVGSGPAFVLQAESGNLVTQSEGLARLSRVRLPGLGLAYVLAFFMLVGLLAARGLRTAGWIALLAGALLAIGLSFNRNMWVGLVVGALLMAALARPGFRRRVGAALGIAAMALALIVLAPGASEDSALAPLVERSATLLDPAELRSESSLRGRENETREAVEVIAQHPLLGVGPGVSFGVFFYEAVGTGYVRTPQLFLHNQYLYLMLVAGIPGLLCFLVFLGSVLRAALSGAARDPMVLALGVGLLTVAVSSLVAIYFSVPDMATVVGLVAGAIVVMRSDPSDADVEPKVRSAMGAARSGTAH